MSNKKSKSTRITLSKKIRVSIPLRQGEVFRLLEEFIQEVESEF